MRPDFLTPHAILTPEMIHRINSDQEAYDENSEKYERMQREANENYEREQQEMYEQERRSNQEEEIDNNN